MLFHTWIEHSLLSLSLSFYPSWWCSMARKKSASEVVCEHGAHRPWKKRSPLLAGHLAIQISPKWMLGISRALSKHHYSIWMGSWGRGKWPQVNIFLIDWKNKRKKSSSWIFLLFGLFPCLSLEILFCRNLSREALKGGILFVSEKITAQNIVTSQDPVYPHWGQSQGHMLALSVSVISGRRVIFRWGQ